MNACWIVGMACLISGANQLWFIAITSLNNVSYLEVGAVARFSTWSVELRFKTVSFVSLQEGL